MCGAARGGSVVHISIPGLSPRVRGSHLRAGSPQRSQGSIPTCAGQPLGLQDRLHPREVYPHVCGAAVTQGNEQRNIMGLSPRVRGSHAYRAPKPSLRGSIPTCAGQPPASWPFQASAEVYPHVCGAAWSRNVICPIVLGLSPRVRGSPVESPKRIEASGSIPTCAGQPMSAVVLPPEPTVYPHVCGAAHITSGSATADQGLSPRVRGSLDQATWTDKGWGSIPTCAGQPATYFTEMRVTAVYPHVCGAANGATYTVDITNGLSPRVRGSLSRRRSPTCSMAVYPHVCGAAINVNFDKGTY